MPFTKYQGENDLVSLPFQKDPADFTKKSKDSPYLELGRVTLPNLGLDLS